MSAARFECPRCQTMFVKDTGGEAAFVECPSCGALALPAGDATDDALSRALSGPQDQPNIGQMSTEAEQAPLGSFSDPNFGDGGFGGPSPARGDPGTGAGVFSGLLAANEPSGPGAASGKAAPDGLDFDFGKDVDLELDKQLPRTHTPKAGGGVRAAARAAERQPAVQSKGHVHAVPEALAAQLQEPPPPDDTEVGKTAPWRGMSDEAFGDLEKAFDEMALRPGATAPQRGRTGLTIDEEAFLRGDREDRDERASGGRRAPPLPGGDDGPTGRRESPPKPPPRRGTKPSKQRPPHLTLTDEAKRLAFLPLRAEPKAEPARARLERVAPKMPVAERARGEQNRPIPSDEGPVSEPTDLIHTRARKEPARTVPSPFRGLTPLRAAGLILLAIVVGIGVGFGITPKPQRPNTPRARAELKFADGNKFYDEGRFDDALGAFKEAVARDNTYSLAHRAKGAALAKLQRFDEAAEAYKRYLELESAAVDAADVQEAIKRREAPKNP